MAQRDDDQAQAPDLGASVQLENSETLEGSGDGDGLDAGYVPPDRPYGLDEDGVTGAGMRAGDTLDERLSRELPDDAEPSDPDRSGRLTIAGAGAGLETPDAMDAVDVGIDGGAASAEEAAVHEVYPVAVEGDIPGDEGYFVETEPSVADDPLLADPELDAALAADPDADRAREEAVSDVVEDGDLLVPGGTTGTDAGADGSGPDR